MAGDESQVGLSGGDLDKNTLGFGEPRGGVSRREREKEGGREGEREKERERWREGGERQRKTEREEERVHLQNWASSPPPPVWI